MSSQNESILRHPKAMLVVTIIDKEKINVCTIIVEDMLLRAKQKKTSFPFLVHITQLNVKAIIPFLGKTDVQIRPTASSDIRMIKAEYY